MHAVHRWYVQHWNGSVLVEYLLILFFWIISKLEWAVHLQQLLGWFLLWHIRGLGVHSVRDGHVPVGDGDGE